MKSAGRNSRFIFVVCLLLAAISASAITFTTDTYIGPTDFSSDGQDIVVTNCTLTVDGAHGFNSLQLLEGGVLTHSAFTNGPGQIIFAVNNESQTLTTNPATLINTNVNTNTIVVMDSTDTITYTPNVDYLVTLSNQFTQLTLTTNSSIADGATVLVSYDWSQVYQGFTLTITNDMDVTPDSLVNLSGMGYAGGNGFGNGVGTTQSTNSPVVIIVGGGGGHGGCGGMGITFNVPALGGASYDTTTNPAILGSGGGNGGAGGGLGQLFVDGTLQVDGQILADGLAATNANSGGGAGGGLLLSAQTFSGAGMISAQGGSGAVATGGGGGGGGIIAIYSATNTFTGYIFAFGGAGANYGGAGTVFVQSWSDSAGQLLIANGGMPGTNTFFSPAAIGNLIVSGGAVAEGETSTFAVSNLFVQSSSALVSLDNLPLTLAVSGDATVESNASINADFKSTSGPGSGVSGCAGTGGGHGGYGGNSICGGSGGGIYDFLYTIATPTALGSPGGGSSAFQSPISLGGGAINLNVAGTLSLDGNISADGQPAVVSIDGGGSGGSVWLTAGTLNGCGNISANGGAADITGGGGGGAGGRVAVYAEASPFTGKIMAHGGSGINAGGPGTVYLQTNSSRLLIVDNGGLIGSTGVRSFGASDLTISGGATFNIIDPNEAHYAFRNLFIGSNSWMAVAQPVAPFISFWATNIIVQSGGGIVTDGDSTGQIGDNGGPGGSGLAGGGGGNGGYGGAASGTNAPGGAPSSVPGAFGGIGGQGSGGGGGNGGGSITLTVFNTLQLDGIISANGATGPGTNGGGGAGGSISLSVGTLSGTGAVSANGGAANGPLGGGGAGGVVAVGFATNLFSGTMSAHGGAGANFGGAGTVYTEIGSLNSLTGSGRQLLIDNGGNRGAVTPLHSYNVLLNVDLSITGGSLVSNTYVSNLRNLTVGSNSTLVTVWPPITLSVLSNATIQAGGSINVDGLSSSWLLQGQSFGNGGTYGGMGGASLSNAPAKALVNVNDSITAPELPGNPGGFGQNGLGGNGGGYLPISISGTLQLDGRISAEGVTGPGLNSGGGSGGAIVLTVGTLCGSGTVSVNGGAANTPIGGGGGGGRIAVYFNTNLFTGKFTAYGGAAAHPGGAGSVFLQANSSSVGQLILDNGGSFGANSPLDTLSQPLDVSVSNGAIASSAAPLVLQSLSIGSNASFAANSQSPLALTVLGNAFVDLNGAITANATGFDPGAGPGSGALDSGSDGSGGGYGGAGGSSHFGAPGGVTYGSPNQPVDFGSAGAVLNSPAGFSQGGGAIRLIIDGALTLNGNISANGNNASKANAGGGSGGSIWLNAQSLAGSGSFTANGGSGASGRGGGGGGGRIAVYANTNSFFGSAVSSGGTGAFAGQPGTVIIAARPLISGSVTDTNGIGISGITIQPTGLPAVTTDSNGSYSFTTPAFWSGNAAPCSTGLFVPILRNYFSVGGNFVNQNYLLTSPVGFNINLTSFDGTNLTFSWYGTNGATYQPLYSSNLVDWLPYGPPYIGSNAPATLSVPVSTAPQLFFRLSVSY